MTNGTLFLGRLLLAACFLPSGIAWLSNISAFGISLARKGVPYTDLLAALIVLAGTFGPVVLVLGLAPRVTASVLIAVTLITTGSLHRYWDFIGAARAAEQAIFLANLGTMAGLLFYYVAGPGAWTWQAWRGALAELRGTPSGRKRKRAPRSRPKPTEEEEPEFSEDMA